MAKSRGAARGNDKGDAMQPQSPQINPYGAPQARVDDYVAPDTGILDQARTVPAGNGLAWYREAWRIFKVSPGIWIGIWVLFAVILVGLSIIPFIGSLIAGVLTPVLVGGIMVAARAADRESTVRFGDLFAGFSGGRAGALLLIGVIQMVISVAIGIALGLTAATLIPATPASPSFSQIASWNVMGPLLLVGAIFAVVFIPVTNAIWLASCLAALHNAGALEALRKGFGATYRNLPPLLVFVVLGVLFGIAASIPLMLGWLVLGPVFMCVIYAQYRDLFAA
jgi:uncharacterized membrane protein